uniref:Uncharacterized protein n=1 Tax=Sym plasmid TaxID=28430 RepID=A0A515HIG4_9ZZZZ|nr:hypothetical protein pTL25_00054 [Sym plasmid]
MSGPHGHGRLADATGAPALRPGAIINVNSMTCVHGPLRNAGAAKARRRRAFGHKADARVSLTAHSSETSVTFASGFLRRPLQGGGHGSRAAPHPHPCPCGDAEDRYGYGRAGRGSHSKKAPRPIACSWLLTIPRQDPGHPPRSCGSTSPIRGGSSENHEAVRGPDGARGARRHAARELSRAVSLRRGRRRGRRQGCPEGDAGSGSGFHAPGW